MISGADVVVVQYYIANLHTSHVTDIQTDAVYTTVDVS